MSLNRLSSPSFLSSDVYTDLSRLQKLKSSARADSQAAIPEAARQFEALMITTMLKNLRKTGMEDPIFKSQAMDSYHDMYDQQLGLELSKGQGIGFAKAIAEQMNYQTPNTADTVSDAVVSKNVSMPLKHSINRHVSSNERISKSTAENVAEKIPVPNDPDQSVILETISRKAVIETIKSDTITSNTASSKSISANFISPDDFTDKLRPLAEQAAKKLGVSTEIILSQAALETGWGKHIIAQGDKSSFNLFNIKATSNWQGNTVAKISAEFSSGMNKSIQRKSLFKAYDSFAQSFDDYVNLIKNSPRYRSAVPSVNKNKETMDQFLHDKSYIKSIHQAGYATDPAYSDKVLRVLTTEAIQKQAKSA